MSRDLWGGKGIRDGWVDMPGTALHGWVFHAWQFNGLTLGRWVDEDSHPAWALTTANGTMIEPMLGTDTIPPGSWLLRRVGDAYTYAILPDEYFRCVWRETVL